LLEEAMISVTLAIDMTWSSVFELKCSDSRENLSIYGSGAVERT